MDVSTAPTVYRFGRFTLDLRKGVVRSEDDPVFLRPKAFALLAHLATNIGRVVPKGELMDAVWPRVTVSEDSLTQAVRELRKALGDAAARLIRTIPGRGYLLDGGTPGGEASSQPTVAVLRFVNVGGQEARVALVDGVAEDILNGLALFRTVTVLARSSSFAMPTGDETDRRAIGERLQADFLVEGSLAAEGDGNAVTVRLVEAASGTQLWSNRYAARGTDIFGVQDDIALQIVNRLVARIDDAARRRAARKPASSLAAYELFVRGVALLPGYGPNFNEEAKALFEAAIAKDPDYGLAYAYLALANVAIGGYGLAPAEVLSEAVLLASRAVTLDPEEARGHRILGMIRKYMRQFGPAENHLRRSLELNPCDADTLMQMGYLQALRGKPVEGLGWMQRALRLNPMHPDWYNVDHAIALYCVGEYRSAAAALERLPILRPWAHAFIAAGQAKAGNPGAAREHVGRMRRQDPDFDPVQDAMLGWNFEHREDLDHLVDGIRLALRA